MLFVTPHFVRMGEMGTQWKQSFHSKNLMLGVCASAHLHVCVYVIIYISYSC